MTGSCGKSWLAITAILLLTGTAFAVVASQNVTVTLVGADGVGNPSEDNAGTATGKLYVDTNSGILYEAVSGVVLNQSSRKKIIYSNFGVSIFVPGQDRSFTATYDQQVIYRAKTSTGFALSGRVAVFYPSVL